MVPRRLEGRIIHGAGRGAGWFCVIRREGNQLGGGQAGRGGVRWRTQGHARAPPLGSLEKQSSRAGDRRGVGVRPLEGADGPDALEGRKEMMSSQRPDVSTSFSVKKHPTKGRVYLSLRGPRQILSASWRPGPEASLRGSLYRQRSTRYPWPSERSLLWEESDIPLMIRSHQHRTFAEHKNE